VSSNPPRMVDNDHVGRTAHPPYAPFLPCGLGGGAASHPLGLRLFHGCGTATLPHKLLPALHERLGRLLWYRLTLNAGFSGLDGQSVRRPRPMSSRRSGAVARGGAGDSIPRLDLRRLRSHPWSRPCICRNIIDSSLPRSDLGWLQSSLRRRRNIRVGIIMYSGLLGFDLPLLHPLPRGWSSPATISPSSTGAALVGGNRFPRLDPGAFPWGRLMGRRLLPWGLRRWRICRRLLGRWRISGEKSLHPAPCLIASTGGGVLDPVAAVVAGLPPLGCLPELAPQAFRTVIQPTADKLLRRNFSFFFQFAFYCAFFFDFCDDLSPPTTGNRATVAALFPIFSRCFLLR